VAAPGTGTGTGTGTWHHLALTFSGSTISAAIDGAAVGTVTDTTYPSGMVGLGTSGYQTDQFDNLYVTPVAGSVTGPIVAGVNTSKCVDDNADSTTNGTQVQMWDCNGGASQNWTFPGNGTIDLGGKCMDITGAGTANGTLVELWTCNGGTNQQWQALNGTLVNPVSGKCLDDSIGPPQSTAAAQWFGSCRSLPARTEPLNGMAGKRHTAEASVICGSSYGLPSSVRTACRKPGCRGSRR
jgi:Ricin-type beta-trefoil lectin domain